ncbi:MAG: hypothetical protein JWN94_4330 [Betaproteobacteria bacterium]|nr:hypothetical protein [Betaproteobacteria bacterium]
MEGKLTIGRVDAEYMIDRAAPDANAIRARCDEAIRERLERSLSATLARWCDRDDASIWVVRRVDIDVAANAILPSDDLSRDVARAVAANLRDVLVGDGDGIGAIRFADAAALLMRFLIDSANGDAWSRWYYGRYRGLGLLPASAVLRTAICEDPGLGMTALQRMRDDEVAMVASAMSANDARAVRINLGHAGNAAALESCLNACLHALGHGADHRLSSEAQTLNLFVHASQHGASGSQLNAAIDALRELQRVLAETGTWPHSMEIERYGEALAYLERAGRRLVADLLKPPTSRVIDPSTLMSYTTSFGGCFLLLPLLAETFHQSNVASAFGNDDSAVAVLRLLVLSACTGADNADIAYEDAVLRFACGIDESATGRLRVEAIAQLLSGGDLPRLRLARSFKQFTAQHKRPLRISSTDKKYFRSIKNGHPLSGWTRMINALAYEVMRRFGKRLPGFTDSSCAYLWKNFLDLRAHVDLETERIVVRLARAPLHLVLNLTGMTGGKYVLPFGDARCYGLFTSD